MPRVISTDERIYRLIADSSADWEYVDGPDGRLLWVSPSCEPISGHSPDEFLKDAGLLLAIVHPEDRALFESHRHDCRPGGDDGEAEFRIVRPDGGVRRIGHRCRHVSLPGWTSAGRRSSNHEIANGFGSSGKSLFRTVAEAEDTWWTSEERYRLLFENMLDGFAYCEMLFEEDRPRDFRYLVVNRAFEELTGLRGVEGRKVSEVIPGIYDAHPELFAIYGRVSLTGRPERFEFRLEPLDAWLSIAVYSSEKGYFTAVFDNITERKRSEARLRELNETLEKRVAERTAEAKRRAVQLKALASELSQAERRERLALASALHDHLQQILVAAKLNLVALQGRFGDESLQSDVLRVAQLLDESITWCRSVTVSLSPPVLQEVGLAGGLGWLARQMDKRHGLQVTLSVCDGWVEPPDADLRAFLFEAVREILLNVVKHAGVLTARVAVSREGGWIEIRVEDDGKGLDREGIREHVEEGASFGLFSVQQRLEVMGGSMSVESAPGQGTRVTLRALGEPVPPRAEAVAGQPPDAVLERAPEPAAARSGRVRVLIADDHRIFRQGFIALLRREEEIEVVGEAADGSEAVELARTLRPDVIVMDVSMPRMGGIEATRQIVAELPGVRVVGLSMHEDEEIAASMREAGAVDFVTKGGAFDAAISAIYAAHRAEKRP